MVFILFNRKLILILIVCIFLVCISVVSAADGQNSTNIDDSQKVDDIKSVKLSTQKLSTTYGSGKDFKVKAIDTNTKKPVSKLKLTLKVYTGKKYKKITKTTDSKGTVKYPVSKLKIGKHKIIVKVKDSKITSKAKTSSVKIKKAKLTISAPKITNKLKESKKFKITVKNKETKKVMKGIKTLVKVFTGKKFKSYSLKTNKRGVVSINTKSLKKGTHKVTVKVKSNSKVKSASAKSSIKTVKKAQYMKLKVMVKL